MHCSPLPLLRGTVPPLLACALLACALSACASGRADGPPQSPAALAAQNALGPGDVFDVRVFGEPDLSGTYRVSSDGTINFPLVGKLKIEGLSAGEISDALEHGLTKFLRQPQVSLLVKEFNSKKVYVFGEVTKPGTFPFEDGMNIVQAITLAGGFTKIANKNGTFVTRVIERHEQRLKAPISEIAEGKAANFRLEPGDIVFVPESIF
jgi:protein involved in polysaccharide export with SLBB domain